MVSSSGGGGWQKWKGFLCRPGTWFVSDFCSFPEQTGQQTEGCWGQVTAARSVAATIPLGKGRRCLLLLPGEKTKASVKAEEAVRWGLGQRTHLNIMCRIWRLIYRFIELNNIYKNEMKQYYKCNNICHAEVIAKKHFKNMGVHTQQPPTRLWLRLTNNNGIKFSLWWKEVNTPQSYIDMCKIILHCKA